MLHKISLGIVLIEPRRVGSAHHFIDVKTRDQLMLAPLFFCAPECIRKASAILGKVIKIAIESRSCYKIIKGICLKEGILWLAGRR